MTIRTPAQDTDRDDVPFRRALDAAGYAILVTGPDIEPPGPTILHANAAMTRLCGYPTAELVGTHPRKLQGPDTDRAVLAALKAALRQGRRYTAETVNYRKDGSPYTVEWVIDPVPGPGGDVVAWVAIQRDVTARRQERIARAESEARLGAIFANASVGLSVLDREGCFLEANHELCRILGRSHAEVLRCSFADVTHPDDVSPSLVAVATAIAGGAAAGLDKRYLQPDGTITWANSTVTPLRDAGGRPGNLLVVTIDLTERRRAEQALRATEERLYVLVAELQHRTRNLIGVVRSMADHTIAASHDLADFRTRFGDRLDALARVQGLLSRLCDAERVAFDELIASELAAVGGVSDRVTLAGPPGVRLRSSTVQLLAMALHELATNAVKYGALGQPQARLAVGWRVDPAGRDGRPLLHVDWRETGVAMPAHGAGVTGTGQGRELIEQALPYQLGAETCFDLTADGLRCTIALPVSADTIAD